MQQAWQTNRPPAETAAWFLAQPQSFHEQWMAIAADEAELAAKIGEVPMGCVIVRLMPSGTAQEIVRTHNKVEELHDPTAHAEVLAVRQAAALIGDWRLTDCALYVTKEPCPMCGGALVLGRLALASWAAFDPKRGAHTVFKMFEHNGLNHHPAVLAPIGGPDILERIQSFFKKLRTKG